MGESKKALAGRGDSTSAAAQASAEGRSRRDRDKADGAHRGAKLKVA
ncbi:hypothetical protein CQA4T8M7_23580 [Sphaerotilus natans]|nr:hypothetical protein CQA4T8M7_23580 [Sphaerotilus natans]